MYFSFLNTDGGISFYRYDLFYQRGKCRRRISVSSQAGGPGAVDFALGLDVQTRSSVFAQLMPTSPPPAPEHPQTKPTRFLMETESDLNL